MSKDFSKMTDEELAAIVGQKAPTQQPDFASMSDRELEQIVGQQSQSQRPMAGEIARPFLQTAKQVAVGTLGSAGDLAQQAVFASEAIGRSAARGLGFDVEPFDFSKVNTASQAVRGAFDTATGGLTEPRGKLEQGLEVAGEIAGGIVGPGAIKTAAQKTADVARLVGKRTLQFGTGITKKSEELVKAFTDSGVRPTLANITEGKRTADFQNLLGNFPGGKVAIEKAAQGQIDDITKQLAGITKSKGGTVQQTGKVIQEGAEATSRATEARIGKLYDDLDQFIPKEATASARADIKLDIKNGRAFILKDSRNVGEISFAEKGNVFNIKRSDVSQPKEGIGFEAYKQLIDSKLAEGKTIHSDADVSLPARKIYEKLAASGYKVEKASKTHKLINQRQTTIPREERILQAQSRDTLTGNLIGEPLYKITGKSQADKIPTNNLKALTRDAQIQDVVAVGSGDTAKVLSRYSDIIDEAGNISYPRLKTFRSTVGAKMQSPSLLGEERGALKKVYAALSEDMKEAVTAQGGEKGLRAFNKANNNFIRATQRLDKQINPLIDAKTPELVYNMALGGTKQGGSNIKPIMNGLNPTQQDFVRGTVAQRMGSATPGRQDAFGEVFSPDKFLTEWNRLSPEARINIFTKEQTGSINTLNKAISSIKEAGKSRQTSNNLPYWAYAGLGGVTLASPATGVGAVAGANITARMMTNPRFVKWLAQAPRVRPAEIPKHLKVLSTISGAGNAELREDILNYLESITIEKE